MSFFEDLTKTFSDKGKEAVNKAKGLTDVLKLKAQLASEKSKLNETFQTIGRKYYELQKSEEVCDEFKADFMAVEAAENRIAALEDEICNLEGCRTCPECGARLSQEDSFCSKCGAKMPTKPTEADAEVILDADEDVCEETCECEEKAEAVEETASECEEAAETVEEAVCECEEAAETVEEAVCECEEAAETVEEVVCECEEAAETVEEAVCECEEAAEAVEEAVCECEKKAAEADKEIACECEKEE